MNQESRSSNTEAEAEHKTAQLDLDVHAKLRAIYDELNEEGKQEGVYYTMSDVIFLLIQYYEGNSK